MTFARWGLPTLFWSTLVLALAVWVMPAGLPRIGAGVVAGLLLLFVIAFFRNPARKPQGH